MVMLLMIAIVVVGIQQILIARGTCRRFFQPKGKATMAEYVRTTRYGRDDGFQIDHVLANGTHKGTVVPLVALYESNIETHF